MLIFELRFQVDFMVSLHQKILSSVLFSILSCVFIFELRFQVGFLFVQLLQSVP